MAETQKRTRRRVRKPGVGGDESENEPKRAYGPQAPEGVDFSAEMRSVIPKLPCRRMFGVNKDKIDHETWAGREDICDWPCPARFILCGRPNSGKSSWVQEIMARANPAYDRIIVIHPDKTSLDYVDYDPIMLDAVPPVDWEGWNAFVDEEDPKTGQMKRRRAKTMCVCDDLSYGEMGRVAKGCLDRLCSYLSTHKFMSVAVCCQDFYSLIPSARRMANVFVMYKGLDTRSQEQCASRLGMKADRYMALFDKHVHGNHDCIVFDLTDDTPAPIRLNGYDVIE